MRTSNYSKRLSADFAKREQKEFKPQYSHSCRCGSAHTEVAGELGKHIHKQAGHYLQGFGGGFQQAELLQEVGEQALGKPEKEPPEQYGYYCGYPVCGVFGQQKRTTTRAAIRC